MISNIDKIGFGPFEFDPVTCELRKSGRLIKIQPQPGRVLSLLAGNPGKLISREEIRRVLWDESTFVDYDLGVDYCISRIRSVLGDKPSSPRYIETLPRRGYRFIASVKRNRLFIEPILAVLPFANLNGDPVKEYFADGVTDALITELARIQSLRVISRQSVLHLKGSSLRLDEIARDLRVDGIVEGAVLHEGSRARITAQLVLLEPESHAWAQSYECDLSDVLTAQRTAALEIAGCIAVALKPSNGATQKPFQAPAQPAAPEIIEAFMMARTEMYKMSAEGIGNALRYLREITIKAPDFAPGLSWHAACLMTLGYWGHIPIREAYPSAKQLAMSARAINDSLEDVHVTLGFLSFMLDWDLAAAEQEFRLAEKLAPSNPDVHTFYAIFLSSVDRLAEASDRIQHALKLDRASLLPNSAAAWIYLHQGLNDKAERQSRRTLELFPDSIHAHFVQGWASWRRHRIAEAVAALEKALSISREAFSLAFLGHIYGSTGQRNKAIRLLQELDILFTKGQAPPIAFAIVHAGLGNMDAAFEWLETAYRLRDDKIFWLQYGPGLEPLRSDPRYASFVPHIPKLART